jgi:hypothetical protein
VDLRFLTHFVPPNHWRKGTSSDSGLWKNHAKKPMVEGVPKVKSCFVDFTGENHVFGNGLFFDPPGLIPFDTSSWRPAVAGNGACPTTPSCAKHRAVGPQTHLSSQTQAVEKHLLNPDWFFSKDCAGSITLYRKFFCTIFSDGPQCALFLERQRLASHKPLKIEQNGKNN